MNLGRWCWLVVGMLGWTACESLQQSPASPPASVARAEAEAAPPPPAPEAERPAAEAALTQCQADLHQVIQKASHVAMNRRSQALLAGLGTTCSQVLPSALREGAVEAAPLRGAMRARRLADAARAFMPERCLTAPEASARTVESHCPPPEDLHAATPLPRSLDVGSYVFTLALREQLRAKGAYENKAARLVAELLLSSALEGEERATVP